MKCLAAVIILLIVGSGLCQEKDSNKNSGQDRKGSSVLMYRDGAGFFIDVPKGWVIDRAVGKRGGTCCVYYPQGSTFNSADTIMYPNIATKGPGQETLNEFMKSDQERFLKQSKGLRYEETKDIPLQNNQFAKVRLFHGVNRGSSEAVAYIDEERIIAVFVMSSKNEKAFNQSMPLFRSAVKTYTYTNIKASEDPAK